VLTGLRMRSIRSSAATVAIGARMRETLVAAGAPCGQIAEIHNWGDDAVLDAADDATGLRKNWGFSADRLVVGYSGNLGRAHELETMLAAARILAARDATVDFLFIGGGALRERLGAAALPNVSLQPYQPRAELPRSMAVADIHWLSLQPALEGLIVPSKFYGVAASGRPILFIGDADGEVARLIRRYQCGWCFAPGEGDAVAALLGELSANRDPLAERGRNARSMVRDHYSRAHGIAAWDALLREVAAP
jgi:colanic acid biosynthesis glycosyl transferase WcaI